MPTSLERLAEKLQSLRSGVYITSAAVDAIVQMLRDAETQNPGTLEKLGTNQQELKSIQDNAT